MASSTRWCRAPTSKRGPVGSRTRLQLDPPPRFVRRSRSSGRRWTCRWPPGSRVSARSRPASSLRGMPVHEGPIGPFPPGADPDEYDRLRRRVFWTMPSGLYVLGSTDKAERRNGMTLNWTTQVSSDPKLLAVSIELTAFTHELVSEGRVFSLNIIDREDRAIVRKFTKPVEVDLAAHTLN